MFFSGVASPNKILMYSCFLHTSPPLEAFELWPRGGECILHGMPLNYVTLVSHTTIAQHILSHPLPAEPKGISARLSCTTYTLLTHQHEWHRLSHSSWAGRQPFSFYGQTLNEEDLPTFNFWAQFMSASVTNKASSWYQWEMTVPKTQNFWELFGNILCFQWRCWWSWGIE